MENHLKITWIFLNAIFFNLRNFSKNICDYIRMGKQTIRMKIFREKYQEYMLNKHFLKVRNCLLEKDLKIKRETE